MREIQKQSAAKDLLLFSIPLVLSGVLHQLYNWADAFIVGHAEGDLALAAVGATAVLVGFLLKLISGFTLGLSIFAAQQYGKQQYNTITRILSTFLLIFGSA
jgi:Na+-driven multidrug efflux pump